MRKVMQTFKSTLLTIVVLLCSVSASPHDFEVDGICYNITSETELTVEVTYNGDSHSSTIIENNGELLIPESVVWNGNRYSVTTVGRSAFENYNINTLIIGARITKIEENQTEPCKTIWLANTPPTGHHYLRGKINYVANKQYNEYGNGELHIYEYLSSMFSVNGVRYVPVNPSERTCDIINYAGDSTSLNIGKTVSYKNITMTVQKIMPYTFSKNKDLKEVVLENNGNIEKKAFWESDGLQNATISNNGNIGEYAFSNCSSLQKAAISCNGDIGEYAFDECTGLQEIKVSNNGNIGEYAFYYCQELKVAEITNSGDIMKCAFYGCSGLEDATIDNNGAIGYGAFCGCSMMRTATLGKLISSLGYEAFSNCENLQEIIVHDSVQSIGEYCFRYCTSLKNAIIGNGVKDIGEQAFEYCFSLENVFLGDNINAVKEWTFNQCKSLSQITLGRRIRIIHEHAFNECRALQRISIPKAITTIKDNVFVGCTKLSEVIIEDRDTKLILGHNGSKSLFSDCPLDSIYIGGKLEYSTHGGYGYSPFYRNTTLRTVVITDKEDEIYDNEFYGCTGLKNVTIGNGVKKIGNWAFSGCSNLDYFAFGKNVESIGEEAFSDCVNVAQIISSATTPPTCGTQALDDINKWSCTLKVPMESLTAYQQADQWKDFFFMEGVETSINSIKPNNGKSDAYNTDGRLIQRNADMKNLKKGLYIINGKKVLVK